MSTSKFQAWCLEGDCVNAPHTVGSGEHRCVTGLLNPLHTDWVQADLEAIRGALLQRRGAFVNLTGDERTLQAAQPLVTGFLEAMPEAAAGPAADWGNALPRINEAITVPTQVRDAMASLLYGHARGGCGARR